MINSKKAIHGRYKRILRMRDVKEMTFNAIAKKLDISRGRAHQLYGQAKLWESNKADV